VDANTNTDLDARSIVTTRLIDAPRELVFAVLSDAGHLAHFWGPDGFTITTHDFDFRVGGVWRFVMHGPDGRDYYNRIAYEEITPPARIVFAHSGHEDTSLNFRNTITLEAIDDRTRLTMQAVFMSVEAREFVAREFHAVEGGQQTLGRLAAYLKTL
jgi:uncharacterized protein YndB with AHSA1/START domain